MKTEDLKPGKSYYYTPGVGRTIVMYKHETINGYLFARNGYERVLTAQSVEQNIEEI